ncbi:MAG: hypothetical protein ACNYPH_07750 [Gammaproteobacteria bacterium WSBS_2016_MAG_OTU1]
MSTSFDELKGTFEAFYPEYISWVEGNSANLPPDKVGDNVFNAQDASNLLLDFAEIIKLVLKDKDQCIKHVSSSELSVIKKFSTILNAVNSEDASDDYNEFASSVEELIPLMRPFQFLSMEKMDEKRYREISDMGKTLSDIRKTQMSVTSTAKKVESGSEDMRNLIEVTNKKNKELDGLIGENNQKMNNLTTMHAQTNKYLNQVNDILNSANSQKSKIDGFVNLIQEREEKIISQNVATEEHEEKLKSAEKYNCSLGSKKLMK